MLAGCAPEPEPTVRELYTFGTQVRLELRGLDVRPANAALDAAETALNRWNRDWYAWGDGELGQLNAALASATRANVSTELGTLLGRADALRQRSGGHFDPTLGRLVNAWGFAGEPADDAAIPKRQMLAEAVARVDYAVAIGAPEATVSVAAPGVVFDLGGVAKGAALEALRDEFRRRGVDRAIVDLGGDVLVLNPSGAAPVRIGIQNPRARGAIAYLVAYDGEAIVTSGDYARFRRHNERRIHHIIDPSTREPGTDVAAVTVASADPLLADAAATALMVAGTGAFHEIAAQMGLEYALMIDSNGTRQMTPAMQRRLVWRDTERFPP